MERINDEKQKKAYEIVEKTGANLFLTGKAGTGKTTFLRYVREHTSKRAVVTASTGVAATNANGVTLHSFLQLPFTPFIPDQQQAHATELFKISKEKANIIRTMDLLIIDEVSMLRADTLDRVSFVLKALRRNSRPFGGVQLLLIGDMQQLPPITSKEEFALLGNYYRNNFFFESLALNESGYCTVELDHVYRQEDQKFITLLNKIRNNEIDDACLAQLNKRYLPGMKPDDDCIRLTTHNRQADEINASRMDAIDEKEHVFTAEISGNFPEMNYPAEKELHLKRGAQVMILKNDNLGGKYFNGKIVTITDISDQHVEVQGKDDTSAYEIVPETWTHTKYRLDETSKEIVAEDDGLFKQYPLRLAWAVTIHKSQGLTFDKAVINTASAFTFGQTYVALSRCRTLEGLYLESPITRASVIGNNDITQFNQGISRREPDATSIQTLQQNYLFDNIHALFDFSAIAHGMNKLGNLFETGFRSTYPKLLDEIKTAKDKFADEVSQVNEKFKRQLANLQKSYSPVSSNEHLHERLRSGAKYFLGKLDALPALISSCRKAETDNKEYEKRLRSYIEELALSLRIAENTLNECLENGFTTSGFLRARAASSIPDEQKKKKAKPTKTKINETADITNPELFEQLKQWRSEKASASNVPAYVILQQKALLGIANIAPRTKESLANIAYVGEKTIANYGDELLRIVKETMDKEEKR